MVSGCGGRMPVTKTREIAGATSSANRTESRVRTSSPAIISGEGKRASCTVCFATRAAGGDPLPHDPFVASPADQRRPPRLKRAQRTHDRPAGQRRHLETRGSRCHILMLARPSMIRPTRQSTEVDRSEIPPICPSRLKFRRPLDDSETEGRLRSIGATSSDVKPANSNSSGDGLGAELTIGPLVKQPRRRRVMSTPWTCAATEWLRGLA